MGGRQLSLAEAGRELHARPDPRVFEPEVIVEVSCLGFVEGCCTCQKKQTPIACVRGARG